MPNAARVGLRHVGEGQQEAAPVRKGLGPDAQTRDHPGAGRASLSLGHAHGDGRGAGIGAVGLGDRLGGRLAGVLGVQRAETIAEPDPASMLMST